MAATRRGQRDGSDIEAGQGKANKVAGSAKKAVGKAIEVTKPPGERLGTEGEGHRAVFAGKVERKVRGSGKN